MIKIENIVTPSADQLESVIRGMRNPLNSWEKTDSGISSSEDNYQGFHIGEADMNLMKRLAQAGSDHRKFTRMLPVWMDITAPLYWIAEHDTYKVGTVRNSCSFMHRGCSKPFVIKDFSVVDDRIYDILSPLEKKHYPLIYPYETEEYRDYVCENGRKYRVYKNGRIFAYQHEYVDSMGRYRHFDDQECFPSETNSYYYELNLGGGQGRERWMVHRLVATVWCDNPNNYATVNHIDGNKGNNCAENLEWCSLEDNIKKAHEDGLMDNLQSLHSRYLRWKKGHRIVTPTTRSEIRRDHRIGIVGKELAEKYGLTVTQVNNIVFEEEKEDTDLFLMCYFWDRTLNILNDLREDYLETKDEGTFQAIRCMLPQGYNQRYTWTANYEVLYNIYKARKNHRLPEWHDFCETIVREVPYFAQIFGIEVQE